MTLKNKRRISGPKIDSFPLDLDGHMIGFSFKSYKRSSPTDTKEEKIESLITLPIPANLVDTYGLRYNTEDLGIAGAGVTAIASNNARGFRDQIANELSQSSESTISGLVKTATRKILNVSDSISSGISVGTGTVENPHVALTFEGVDLREHSFTWRFVPESLKESQQLRNIINAFKYHSLPETTDTLYYTYPSLVDVFVLGTEGTYIYEFKTCMIRSISTNYAPDNIPAFYEKFGAPVSVEFSVTLTETAPITRNEIKEVFENVKDTENNEEAS